MADQIHSQRGTFSFNPPLGTKVSAGILPLDDPRRHELHYELHARLPARIRLPALVVYVAVFNEGVTRESELNHLRLLSGQGELKLDQLAGTFLHLSLPGGTLRWERHTEFTSYTLVQPLSASLLEGAGEPDLLGSAFVDPAWLQAIPGRTFAAIELIMLSDTVNGSSLSLQQVRRWFGENTVVASLMGQKQHSYAVSDFRLRPNGFERILVVASPETLDTRSGRIAARLLELETYRMLALVGLPVAKSLQGTLAAADRSLVAITSAMAESSRSDQTLLNNLEVLAGGIEQAIAQYGNRFTASAAYEALVYARLADMHETAIPGIQTIGEFVRRRFTPAIATVKATSERLTSLSQRVERAGTLLATQVSIVLEQQNQQLLAKLKQGQETQFRLQRTVEGLSIAAISYYVVSLLFHFARAAEAAGLPVRPDLVVGVLIPVVIWGVWRLTRRIHEQLLKDVGDTTPPRG